MSNSFITNVNTLVDNLSAVYTANEKLTPEVINQLTALNLVQLQAVYVELAKIVDVQANMSSVVTTAGAIESIVTLANYLDAASAPSIVEDLILINSKLDALTASVDFLTETITGLGSAQLAIESQSSPVFADIPTVPTIMPFNVETPSSNTDIISTDALQDTITFKLNGSYTFTSNVSVTSKTNTTVALTFKIVDIATGNVLATESNTVHISEHSTATLPLTTLLTISNAPVTVRVEAQSTASGYELTAFNSLLVSSVTVRLPDIYAERLYVVEKDSSTGAANLPSGNTAERPVTAELGAIRYNTDINEYEGYTDSGWESLAAVGQIPSLVVTSISGLLAADTSKVVNVLNYHTGLEGGGGVFYWDASKPKTKHNGGTVIDPAKVFPTDWNNQTQLTTWFTAGTGAGCWVRKYDGAVNVKWFGAKGDGTTDDTKSLLSFVNGNTNLYVPDGHYIVDSDLELEYNTTLVATKSSLLDFSASTNSTNHVKTKDVPLVSLPNLTSDAKQGDRNIYFESAHGLEQGDVVVFYNPTDYSWSTSRSYYRKGERAKVGKVVSPTYVMLESNLFDTYLAGAATQMGKHEVVVGCSIEGLNIKGRHSESVVVNGLELNKCVDSKVSGVNIKGASYICCSISECFNVSVTDSNFEEDMGYVAGGEYGLGISNSQNIFVTGCYAAANRHGITTGGSSGFGKVVNYSLHFSQCTVGTIGGSHAADMHENTAYSGYDNCILNGTVGFGGHCNFVRNCKIIEGNTEEGNDSAVHLKCSPSMEHTISGNTFVSSKLRDNVNGNPMIYTILEADTQKGGEVSIINNKIEWNNPVSSVRSVIGTGNVRLQNVPTKEKRNIRIEGNTFVNKGEYCHSFVLLRRSGATAGTKGLDTVSIKGNNVSKVATLCYLANIDNNTDTVADTVCIEGNILKDSKSTGLTVSRSRLVKVANNILEDYIQTTTGSSTTNSAAYIYDTETVIEYSNYTYSSYGLDARRMAFFNVVNLYRGQKANLGGKVDSVSGITNDITM